MGKWLGSRERGVGVVLLRIRDAVTSFWGTGGATEAQVADSFATWTARVIVAVSIAGALVSYQASRISGSADGSDQRALRESNYEELSRNAIRAAVSFRLRLLGEYEESWYADGALQSQLQSNPDSLSLRVERLRALRRHQAIRGLLGAGFAVAETAAACGSAPADNPTARCSSASSTGPLRGGTRAARRRTSSSRSASEGERSRR